MSPLISVIITTKNEEKNIANCIESVLRQSYDCDKIEIIVVDNNSTDKTKEIVLSYSSPDKGRLGGVCNDKGMLEPALSDSRMGGSGVKRFTPLNVQLFNWGPERSAQRNYGVKKSNGGYFLYLDADMILRKDVIKECVEKTTCHPEFISGSSFAKTSNPIALYIPEIIMGKSFWCKVRRFERSFYDGTVIDCARFIKKDKFLEVGGFDETMSGPEDWDLDRKLRRIGKTVLISSPIYHNEAEFDLKKYLNKKGYYTKSFDAYVSKLGKDDPEIKKQLGFYYRFIGVFIENGKWKKLIAHPILIAGVYFLRFLVGVKYITRKR